MSSRDKGINRLTASPPKVVLLLIQFILIKIGNLPLLAVNYIYTLAKGGFLRTQRALESTKSTVSEVASGERRTLASASKRVRLPTVAYLLRHRRGRPRTTPFVPFYLRKINKNFYSKIPGKVKVSIAFATIMLVIFSYTSFVLSAAYQLPSPDRLVNSTQPLTTEFYDRNGKILYRLYEGKNRTLVKLEDLPAHLIQATIAIEDKNFYYHIGFDLQAILRALYRNLTEGKTEGASTITQQLIKNSLLTPEKTYSRKIKEIMLAFWAERLYSKNQILQMYFNEAPYGGPQTGIAAASQVYFGKIPKDLNLAESAFLAGLPASPTQFSPYGISPNLAKIRQEQVLQRMVEEKFITQDQKMAALNENLALKPQLNNIFAPHFVFYVKDLLTKRFGPSVVSQGGLKIHTSLDLSLQQAVEKIVSEEVGKLTPLNVQNGAAMVMDAKTGQILAMVGSRDYHYPGFGNFNATLSLRQPGSSVKVITYATAFKKGYSPGNTILDSPVTFKDEWGNSYAPINYDGKYHGPVSIRSALGNSYNVPAVRMLATLGLDPVIQTARDLGITTFTDPKNYGLSLTLGGAAVRMIEMMGVYGSLSQLGTYHPPTPLLRVTDSENNVLEEYENYSKEALSQEVAYLITHILSDNNARASSFGTNSLLNLGPNVAVKTGTSDSKRDNWTFGYNSNFVVGVWVGNNDNSPMNPSLASGITGAAPIWNKIMKGLLEISPNVVFSRPSGIIEAMVDGRKDLMVSNSIPKGLVKAKTDGDKIIFSDAFSSFATSSAQAAIKDNVRN